MNNEMSAVLEQLDQWFVSREKTLSFAESCTGGLVSSYVTKKPGVSRYFLGSVVCYANQIKTEILGVPNSSILALGAVSVPVAKHMALGVREVLRSDWSVSITGVAGPSGGTPRTPVGTVCMAVAGPSFVTTARYRFEGDRESVQEQTALQALHLLKMSVFS